MSDHPQYTWNDWAEEFDPESLLHEGKLERERRIEEQGCLVRALASVLGTELTQEQIDLRLNQIESVSLLEIVYLALEMQKEGLPVDMDLLVANEIREAQARALSYLDVISQQTDTEAGRVLAGLDYGYETLSPEEIISNCAAGNRVVWAEVGHAAHIVPSNDGRSFISLSDGGIPFVNVFDSNHVIVFSDKK